MEQFVLLPVSVYNNNNLNTLTVTMQELPKYQAEQNPTYQLDSLKKKINEKLFAKADSLVDEILSCPPIKFSNSQTLVLDGVETGILLSEFAQHHRRSNADVAETYFTLLDTAGVSPSLVLIQIATAKERGIWVPFKI